MALHLHRKSPELMSSFDFETLRPFFRELERVAAAETLPRFRTSISVDNKAANARFDPVTEADRAAEQALRNLISAQFPDHGIQGEEGDDKAAAGDWSWIIDPIDGTRSYISGLPLWGTLIALYHNKIPVAGVMNQPFTGERYLCDGIQSLLVHNDERTVLRGTIKTELSDCLLLTTSPKLFSEEEQPLYDRMEQAIKMARYGTDCYGYALVAAGHVDMVVESGLHIYDIAALIPIIEKAGGKVTNWQGGSCAEGGQVLACGNEIIHKQALEILNAG